MLFGYNTNGFAHHRLDQALSILGRLGYRSVAITLDHYALNPSSSALSRQVEKTREILHKLDLRCVIETGARFLLDSYRKHQPTLLSAHAAKRERRLCFLKSAIDIAHDLGADVVSFWSGAARDAAPEDVLLERLIDGCRQLCDYAAARQVRLAFEPEPGMFIDTMKRFQALHARF